MANDQLEVLAESLFSHLGEVQRLWRDASHSASHSAFFPMIAASHFAAHFVTAGWANRCGLHAVSLGTARQAFEALTIIELGFLGEVGLEQLVRWEKGAATSGGLRKWLQEGVWTTYPSGLGGVTWSEFMSNLGRSLQPYAHFSPGLLQWNMNMVNAPDEHTGGVVAIGPSYDPLRAQRIQLLRGALLWTLGTVAQLGHRGGQASELIGPLATLRAEVENSEWFSGPDWSETLIPHVW